MLVSVVITTKNEEKNIENCLRSIKEQTYPQELIEIIVVDNNSTDRTKEIARKYTDKVYDKGPERSAQRNYGINLSKGEYFLFLDADMILDKCVILECVNTVQKNTELIGLYISEIIMGDSYFCRVRRFERSFYDGTVIDCVRFVQKQAFIDVEGFNETMTGPEDWDFDKKIRNLGKVDLIKIPIYHNEEAFDFKGYLKKKKYYSQWFDIYKNKWGYSDPDIRKQFGVLYRFFIVFFEKNRWKKVFLRPHLFIGLFLLRLLVGIKYILK